jgi:myo-inositol-1-phosphate synthase
LIDDDNKVRNVTKDHTITTERNIPRLGVMLVGLGGNNGSTFVAGILANKKKL